MIDLRNAQMPFHTQISTNAQMNQCKKQQMPFHLPKMHKPTKDRLHTYGLQAQMHLYIHMPFTLYA